MRPTALVSSFVTVVLSVAALVACDNAAACKADKDCQRSGRCSANEKGACVVGSDQDCKGADPCKLRGLCSAKAGACVAADDAGCAASEECKKLGNCNAYQGTCVNLASSVHAECAKTCEAEGLCVQKDGACVALSRQHCAGTNDEKPEAESACKKLGLCAAENGLCVASSDDDCKKADACKSDGTCAASGGR